MAEMTKDDTIIERITSMAIVALAALAGVVIFMKGKQSGKAATLARIDQQELRGAAAARNIRIAVRRHTGDTVDRRLRDEGWMR